MPAHAIILTPETRDPRERIWRKTAAVAGAFVVTLAVLLVSGHLQAPAHDPLKAAALIAAREELRTSPREEALKEHIRELDLATRAGFFRRLARNEWGGWLLAASFVWLIFSAKHAAAFGVRPPNPKGSAGEAATVRERTALSLSVAGSGGLALAALVALALVGGPPLPPGAEIASASGSPWRSEVAENFPSAAEYNANWPRFRGPAGAGVSGCTNTAVSFSIETGSNVMWKSVVTLGGVGSAVVWRDRVFLSGSDGRRRELFCFDAATGTLSWRLPVALIPEAAVVAMKIPASTGIAAATVATDGERVYAIFGTGELVAADVSGRLVWSKNLGTLDNMYGHAASLVTWHNRVLLQLDQGNAIAGKSKVIAFDGRTGNAVWEQKRPVGSAWTTPFVARLGGREQFITESEPWLVAYAPADGKELWRFGGLGAELAASPIIADGLVIAVDPYQRLLAVKPDGQGDVTSSHLAWSAAEFIPDVASPVSNGELLFTLQGGGLLACLETATGKKVWEHNFETACQASPTIAGGKLYLFSSDGEAIVVAVAREFAELGRGRIGEPVTASPAIVRDRIYVRGENHLFSLGATTRKEVARAR